MKHLDHDVQLGHPWSTVAILPSSTRRERAHRTAPDRLGYRGDDVGACVIVLCSPGVTTKLLGPPPVPSRDHYEQREHGHIIVVVDVGRSTHLPILEDGVEVGRVGRRHRVDRPL